jgi:hypothetical protein
MNFYNVSSAIMKLHLLPSYEWDPSLLSRETNLLRSYTNIYGRFVSHNNGFLCTQIPKNEILFDRLVSKHKSFGHY